MLRATEARKPVEQLFASLNELQGQDTGSNAVLELLAVLSEEVLDDQSLLSSVDSSRRFQFTQEVRTYKVSVLHLLGHRSLTRQVIGRVCSLLVVMVVVFRV